MPTMPSVADLHRLAAESSCDLVTVKRCYTAPERCRAASLLRVGRAALLLGLPAPQDEDEGALAALLKAGG